MSNIYIGYLSGCFDESDIEELIQINRAYGINLEIQERKPVIINAALDELVEEVLLFINSSDLQTVISIFNIADFMVVVVKWIWSKLKLFKIHKITSSANAEKPVNVIIQVDNIKILLDENLSEEDLSKYLRVALRESKTVIQETENKPTVIEGDNDMVIVYKIEEYAKKKIGVEHKTIRKTRYRKYSRRR